ncbi:MAG: potassium transporter TrkG [Kiritimatiellia bacterium]
MTAPRLLFISSTVILLLGALLLALPFANRDAAWHVSIRTLTLAASAVSVTGLDPVDIAQHLTTFGFFIIALLVQIGGIGIMTFGTQLFLMVGRSLSVHEERTVKASLGESRLNALGPMLHATILFTFFSEIIGAAILAWRFHASNPALYPPLRALGHGAFFSIMGFCNAGFSLYEDSVMSFASDPIALHTVTLLSVIGGLGFIVIMNLFHLRPWKRDRSNRGYLSLHSRIVLSSNAILFACSTILFILLESNAAFAGMSFPEQLSRAAFHSSALRSAGFSVFPAETMTKASELLSMIYMFIGGAPGSTAGGIKVSTLVVLAATVRAAFCSRRTPELHFRSIPRDVVNNAIAILALCSALVLSTAFLLSVFEAANSNLAANDILFESISAFSNCGLEPSGRTASLSDPSLFFLAICMFFGRLGPVTIGLTLFHPRATDLTKRYPEENVIVG